MMMLLDRTTLNPDVMQGKPTIRNMRFSVNQLLELLAAGMTTEEVLADYPFLESEDIQACFAFAAKITNARTRTLQPQ
jgi:uncharacterized protein (DUF433 family)